MNFERGIDPKKAIGLGVFSKRDFKHPKNAASWILDNLLAILEISKDEYQKVFNKNLMTPEFRSDIKIYLSNYIKDYITINEQLSEIDSYEIVIFCEMFLKVRLE